MRKLELNGVGNETENVILINFLTKQKLKQRKTHLKLNPCCKKVKNFLKKNKKFADKLWKRCFPSNVL